MNNYQISKTEIEDLTGGLTVEELVDSIDQLLLFVLLNAHQLDMRDTKDNLWGTYMARTVLCKINEETKE